jgi:hypothetical protein
MARRRGAEPGPKPEKILLEEEIVHIIFLSFHFSQGSQALQEKLLVLTAALHPEWSLPDNFNPAEFAARHRHRFEKHVGSAKHVILNRTERTEVPEQIEKNVSILKEALSRDHSDVSAVAQDTLASLVNRDTTYTIREDSTRAQDPAFSYFISYVLHGSSAPGLFEETMEALRQELRNLAQYADTMRPPMKLIITFLAEYRKKYPKRKLNFSRFRWLKKLVEAEG